MPRSGFEPRPSLAAREGEGGDAPDRQGDPDAAAEAEPLPEDEKGDQADHGGCRPQDDAALPGGGVAQPQEKEEVEADDAEEGLQANGGAVHPAHLRHPLAGEQDRREHEGRQAEAEGDRQGQGKGAGDDIASDDGAADEDHGRGELGVGDGLPGHHSSSPRTLAPTLRETRGAVLAPPGAKDPGLTRITPLKGAATSGLG